MTPKPMKKSTPTMSQKDILSKNIISPHKRAKRKTRVQFPLSYSTVQVCLSPLIFLSMGQFRKKAELRSPAYDRQAIPGRRFRTRIRPTT
jgi:hypothetical protein